MKGMGEPGEIREKWGNQGRWERNGETRGDEKAMQEVMEMGKQWGRWDTVGGLVGCTIFSYQEPMD